MTFWQIFEGDCRDQLAGLDDRSVHTVVTSPPYFGLRDYGTGEWDGGDDGCDHMRQSLVSRASSGLGVKDGRGPYGDQFAATQGGTVAYGAECGKCGARRVDRQIGLEPTTDEFVQALVQVFREVRRVLRDDGTVWLNLGDSFANAGWLSNGMPWAYKPKDLIGIPWMVAFALRADGWYLRSDVIWAKPNPMPESVTDRPTKSHEYLFLLSKSTKYHYDADAIREPYDPDTPRAKYGGLMPSERAGNGYLQPAVQAKVDAGDMAGFAPREPNPAGRNKRSVWTVATQPFSGCHFATFPPKLIEPCILAGCPERCCGECGSPWVRVVEREAATPARQSNAAAEAGHYGAHRANNERPGGFYNARSITKEWKPMCKCSTIRVWPINDGSVEWEVVDIRGEGSTLFIGASRSECEQWLIDNCDDSYMPTPVPGVVLDPFAGAGTTGLVALRHNRSFIGIELNPEYAQMARHRIIDDQPLFNTVTQQ